MVNRINVRRIALVEILRLRLRMTRLRHPPLHEAMARQEAKKQEGRGRGSKAHRHKVVEALTTSLFEHRSTRRGNDRSRFIVASRRGRKSVGWRC